MQTGPDLPRVKEKRQSRKQTFPKGVLDLLADSRDNETAGEKCQLK